MAVTRAIRVLPKMHVALRHVALHVALPAIRALRKTPVVRQLAVTLAAAATLAPLISLIRQWAAK